MEARAGLLRRCIFSLQWLCSIFFYYNNLPLSPELLTLTMVIGHQKQTKPKDISRPRTKERRRVDCCYCSHPWTLVVTACPLPAPMKSSAGHWRCPGPDAMSALDIQCPGCHWTRSLLLDLMGSRVLELEQFPSLCSVDPLAPVTLVVGHSAHYEMFSRICPLCSGCH